MNEPRVARPWDLLEPEDRDYFDVLGDGLVAVEPRRAEGDDPRGGWSPAFGGAWVHIGPDGKIRAFTGKADVGQGTRTALTLLVAEELRVAPSSVELRGADTDESPWDIGTFGSRSMPDVAPALSRAAARARRALRDLARDALGRPAEELTMAGGMVRAGPAGAARSYGELVRGRRRLVVADDHDEVADPRAWEVAGRPSLDAEGLAIVTGRRRFGSDLRCEGLGYGAVLRPPAHGARRGPVDLRAVRARRGIVVVEDGEFVGVVADRPSEARRAIAAIRAAWSPGVSPTMSELERYLREHPCRSGGWDTAARSEGDPDAALPRCPDRIQATYRASYIAHVPLETRAALARWDGERLTVWLGTQTPFRAREVVAKGLGIPIEHVRIHVPPTGAGFGGKHGGDVAMDAARLARGAGRPVLLTFTREEEFQHGYLRPYSLVDATAATDASGHLLAWTFHNVNAGAAAIEPPYRIPNVRLTNELSESPLPQGAYRALAANANNFARETLIDELAIQRSLDPLRFRLDHLDDPRLVAVLRRAADEAGWSEWRRPAGRGHGLAIGREKGGRVATIAEVHVDPDRAVRVERIVTVVEAGAIVHPANLRSQVEGATVMALGGALFEEIRFASGRILNGRLSQYRVPRFSDLPRLEIHLIDRRESPPAGAGETPMIAVAPAVGNAIFDATGVRLRSLPLRLGAAPAA